MKLESTNLAGNATLLEVPKPTERVAEARKQKEQVDSQAEEPKKSQIPPEEFLEQVKKLTEDGLFSVRFEKDEAVDELVVKIVDRETDEVIRQVPAEELLELRAALEDLRGSVVDTQG